ncbi:MAG: hypothetical protein WAN65_13345 [Candidatus Sulfotelmatobacter sp.]
MSKERGIHPEKEVLVKRIIETSEASAIESLLDEQVLLFCLNYIYTGKLVAVNDTTATLADPSIVYETGSFKDSGYKDAQKLHVSEWNIALSAIESFGKSK